MITGNSIFWISTVLFRKSDKSCKACPGKIDFIVYAQGALWKQLKFVTAKIKFYNMTERVNNIFVPKR